MNNDTKVGIFWDYENCSPPAGVPGYVVTEQIRKIAHHFGIINVFKAYLELSSTNVTSKVLGLRSELQSSGVSLTDCPRNGRKDVADKMILCDLLAFALDNPSPAVVMLISGDRDFNYAISLLRHRRYTVILVIPPQGAHMTLKSQANVVLDWRSDVFAIESKEDIESYASASAAVGHPLGANGTGVLSGSLSLGSSGLSSVLNGPNFTTSPPLSNASASIPSVASTITQPLPIPSPSTEIPLPSMSSYRNITPPQQFGSLPVFGTPDVFLDRSPATTAFNSSPSKSQTGYTHRKRGSQAVNSAESPVLGNTLQPSTRPEDLYATMIEILEHWRLIGNDKPLRSQLGGELRKKNPWVYDLAKVQNFAEYTALAEKAGIVILGNSGISGQEWIQLHPKHQGKVFPLFI